MKRALAIMVGAALILLLAMLTLVAMPYVQLSSEAVPEQLEPYTTAQQRGRDLYIANGCVYCHSQQPRDPGFSSADGERGWGRPSVPGDYTFDQPHLMGTMRTGPDLFNIGARQPSVGWHLLHLYNPRAVVEGSIMPAYRFLFRVVDTPAEGDRVVKIPEPYGPESGIVVATREALELTSYLLSLDRTYPASTLPQAETAQAQGEGQ
ncbi:MULTISPECIES: cbb3-type cytochrome c oxidase subunit II [unclassified Halomonas]|uniref:cbb3-type cytochrome c oxidase subunit II n=1 Tax=unclassified Halomonas TaxID=2609666 RepID=UPI002885FA42|nr:MULTISPECIES: cbb3-type cytochrome c oxidase subunit II [unclassified Halomonas]MDT0500097.1 cbb3-type cytochrome c oxidase subunit II [Halomonas sp. PAR7]MDT0512501.1 cbb3-type cytochrome c oxidase subunit II [Halomonas sp. LES1]MDT0591135.1 cbb3-type cytochrome c oxidase subunit II [Halomonas sp. PAR8]